MKLAVLLGSIAVVCAATAFAVQTGFGQAPSEQIRVFGCLQGDGSNETPWVLAGAVLPPPPGAAPPAAPAAGRGDAGRGAAAPRGDGGGRGGAADAGRGAAGGGRGGDTGRGAAPAAAPAPPPPPPPVNLRLTGVNMSPWRRMYVEVHGNLVGQRPASG